MAVTSIKNATVTRLNKSGHGFGVKEESTSKGKTYTTYWTVWATDEHTLQVGDVVNVSGFLSTKVGDPKTGNDGVERRYVEHSLNSPRIERAGGQQASPARTEPAVDAWAEPDAESLPF